MSGEGQALPGSVRATGISDWLGHIGLGRYAGAFAENAITLDVLPELTDTDLRDMGVLLGDRKVMLREIANLRSGGQTIAPPPAPEPVTAPAPAPPPEKPQVAAPPPAPPANRTAPQPARPKPEAEAIDPKSLPAIFPGARRVVQEVPTQASSQKKPPLSAPPPKALPVAATEIERSPAIGIAVSASLDPEKEIRQQAPKKIKSRFDRMLAGILASRFLTVSALIHLLILLLFGGKVLFDKYVEPPDFQSTGESMFSPDTAPIAPPQTPEDALPPAASAAAPPPVAAASSLTAISTLNPSATSFSVPIPDMAPPTIGDSLSAQPQQAPALNTGAAVALPGAMAGRGSGREGVGRSYGERPAAEQSVLRALRWLQTQQQTDGTWGASGYSGAFTGLALLCYLGHGETPQTSQEFGVVVTNALNALVTEGTRSQGNLSFKIPIGSQNGAYVHGICTYALCEAYDMTKDERLAPIVAQAVDYIVKGQRPDGGWAYGYSLDPAFGPSDTSVSGWQIQALKAAHLTGLPGMDKIVQPVLDKAMKNLDRVFNRKDGSFGYRVPGDRDYALTGLGVLAKLFWLGRPDRTVREGLVNIMSKDLDYNGPNCNLYAWYYDTQACFQAQEAAWDWWNRRFQDQLTNNQSADGSWPVPPKGVDPTNGFGTNPAGDGPLYRTTLCCLMLEVFYRYLPTSNDSALGGGVNGL
jgi:hypothetical protein